MGGAGGLSRLQGGIVKREGGGGRSDLEDQPQYVILTAASVCPILFVAEEAVCASGQEGACAVGGEEEGITAQCLLGSFLVLG
jgi:hypothetical protein